MSSYLKYMILTVQLADNRVLLSRKNHGGWRQWSITHETFLCNNEVPLVEANKHLLNIYGVNGSSYREKELGITQLTPIDVAHNRKLFPYIMKMNTGLRFRVDADQEYRAMDWYDIVDEVITGSLRHSQHQWPNFTPTAVFAVRALHNRKVFD